MSDFLNAIRRAWRVGVAEYHRAMYQYKRRRTLQQTGDF